MVKNLLLSLLLIFCISFSFSQTDSLLKSGSEKQKDGKHQNAISDFSTAIKNHEAEAQTFLKKWDEYYKIGDFDRAEKGMEAPVIDTAFALPYYLRGFSFSAIGKNNESINDLNTALKINSKLKEAYYQRGKLLWTIGKKDEGCMDLSMAGSLGDSLAKDMFNFSFCKEEAMKAHTNAVSKLRLNQYQEALDLIQKSIKICPDSGAYLTVRGNCYFGMKKNILALNDFDKAITISPNSADAFLGRGIAFYLQGKHQEAFNDLAQSIQINPGIADAYLYRAYACEGMNKSQSALYDYQQVQRLRPTDALAYYKSGIIRNELNDKKGACKDFSKAASLGSEEAVGFLNSCK